jgi:SAM-dependent methyltransferase
MDRSNWLKEKRRRSEERMDTLFAPLYDEKWGVYGNATHRLFIHKFLSFLPQSSTILDAACGTGKYWPMLLEKGHTVVGIDQSQGMLSRAKAKFPSVPVKKVGLQEMLFEEAFDGIICVDAMEFVSPEDWPVVLRHFYRALRPDGRLYFTVELADVNEIQAAFEKARRMGFPVVYGEWAHEGGYHYYPEIEKVKEWVQLARFHLIDETVGDDYHHFLVQKQ